VSVESPSPVSSEPSHGGPAVAWETLLATCEWPLSRRELAEELVERGHAEVRPAAVDMIDAAIARGELVRSGEGAVAVSRQSNLNKSVTSATAENSASDSDGDAETPGIAEKVTEFAAEYPIRATTPLAKNDGTKIRRDYAKVETTEWVENQPDTPEFEIQNPAKGEAVTDVSTIEWGEAVRTLLESYRTTKRTTVNLEKGQPGDAGYAEFSVEAENRWFASYQKRYFAQLDAWLRELCGGERPSGGGTEASFDDPNVVLLTRSASSLPDGERVGPVDHAQVLRDSWEPVYHTLRNTLRSEGYELGEDWQYDRRLEPHTGKRGSHGLNECYAHEHIILVIDGDISADDLRPVIEKHVGACEWAGADAHGDGAIEVRKPSELEDVAAYVADYCSIDPVELLEREPDYIAWAAAMTAGNIRTVSRSEAARAAAKADSCKQRYESEEAEQSVNHGENVVLSQRAGYTVECAECGSPHGIEQTTLTEQRTGTSSPTAVADGGREVMDREAREAELRERWPSADAAASVGESPERHRQRQEIERALRKTPDAPAVEVVGRLGLPPDAMELVAEVRAGVDREEAVGFDEYVPKWHVKSVTVDGEERPASAGNQIDMVEVTDIRQRLREGVGIDPAKHYRCECGVGGWGSTIVSHLGSHGIGEPEVARELISEESV